MAGMKYRATVEIVDKDGSFANMTRKSRKMLRGELKWVVRNTTAKVWREMVSRVPFDPESGGGPDYLHLRDALTTTVNRTGMVGRAGVINNKEEASIGLYNEYGTLKMDAQSFAVPAAQAVTPFFQRHAYQSVAKIETLLKVR